jgi:hypothetical protein
VHVEWNVLLYYLQRLSHSCAGDASANWVELRNQRMHFQAGVRGIESTVEVGNIHSLRIPLTDSVLLAEIDKSGPAPK